MIKENISLVKHCYGFFFSLAELKVRLNNSNEFIIQHTVTFSGGQLLPS